jgi:hypothetical protein
MRRPPTLANAFKHGVFTKMVLLPWEDPREFEKLYNALVEEWTPAGPTEHDAVLSIAKATWRKRRMQYFMHCERMRAASRPNHIAYDEANALRAFSHYIGVVLPNFVESGEFDRAAATLPAHVVAHLKENFPRKNFESILEWVDAIQK